MELENIIYCGDNLIWLKKFPDKCVDLIYLDPPFFSNKNYEIIWNDGAEIRSFEDRWKGGITHYIGWMKDRVAEMYRVLKDTGSLYLHCDWHASHYLKIMCDEIFGYNNFRNNIVWCYKTRQFSKKYWNKKHDDILFYTKTKKYTFNYQEVLNKYSESTIKKYKYKDENGYYRIVGRGIKGSPFKSAKDLTPLQEKQHPDLITRSYLKKGYPPEDYWYIDIINQASKERLKYPTQKPEVLLERILVASSNPDDLVLDPFCGCGTTISVAQQQNRKWIGIDVSPSACRLMRDRVAKYTGKTVPKIVESKITMSYLKSLKPTEFQNRVIQAMGGSANVKKTGDMGIDGVTLILRNPIQVKQSEHVGRNVVDNFETAIERANKDKGVIVAFSFTKGAYDEVTRAKKKGLYIDLLEVDKILEYSEEKVSEQLFEYY